MNRTEQFATKLNHLLEVSGMSQSYLADKLDLDSTSINKYCHAKRLPTLKVVQKMASVLGVTTDYLLSLDDTVINPEEKSIPILGEVRAGQPSLIMENNIIGYENISEEMSCKGELFALRIKGDSMSPRFMESDTVIIKRQPYADNGDIAVVLVNGDEATIKLYQRTPLGITLTPFNDKYDVIKYSNDEITSLPVLVLGVVIELRARKFS